MKRKGARDIPDFSGKSKVPPKGKQVEGVMPKGAVKKAPVQQIKPHSTSAKSGQRGR